LRRPKASVQAIRLNLTGWVYYPTPIYPHFPANSKELESSFGMLGVSLNEAVTLYRGGSLALSFEEALLVSGLCLRFTRGLDNILRSLGEHAKAHGTVPSVASLKPADYQGQYGMQSALASSLRVLAFFSQHSRFLDKIRTLRNMVKHIGNDIRGSADLLGSQGATIIREPQWLIMTDGVLGPEYLPQRIFYLTEMFPPSVARRSGLRVPRQCF
jgi:hypothetical protein